MKRLAVTALTLLVAGCAAGGGCSSCTAMTPIPGGFPLQDRVENAGSARVTQSGMEFIAQNLGTLSQSLLGSGVVTFPISEDAGPVLFCTYTVCPGGSDPNANPPRCVAEIDLCNAQLELDPMTPHDLRIHGSLPIRLQDLPIEVDCTVFTVDAVATINGNDACGSGTQTYAGINLDVDISVETDADGYSRAQVGQIVVNQNQVEDSLHFTCGESDDILNALKGILVPLFKDQLIGTLDDQLNQQLASTRLGSDGHIDLGRLLAGVSPGTTGGLDILFAAGGQDGDLNPVGGGATLGLYGGARPSPPSKRVPLSEIPLPAGIPIPDELLANTVPSWPASVPGPHVGIALSERFANHALNAMHQSGLFCLGITTETVPLLNSGTFKLIASSSEELGLQKEPQPIGIVARPGAPPKVTFGDGTSLTDDPLLRIRMEKASFDVYVWSLDRFIRFMTATYDLDIPASLVVTPAGLVPDVGDIGVSHGSVTNSGLLREDPQALAEVLGQLIADQAKQVVEGIPPIDLSGALAGLGLGLKIPETVDGQGSPGLRRFTKGEDSYLGIFASFTAGGQPCSL